MIDCDTVRELLEARAIEALEPADAYQVDEHLPGCTDCRGIYEGYRRAALLLPEAVAVFAPDKAPAALRERLLSRLDQDWHKASPRRPPFLFRPQVAAVVVLILLALSVGWTLRQASALARERSLRAELTEAIGQQEIIFEVVDSARTTKAFLRATDPGSTSYGKLYTRPDMPYVVGLTGRLPKPPDGFVYNLWLTVQGKDFLAGAMSVTESGFAIILYEAPSSGPTYEAARVVLQADGSVEPTGTTVLRWEASK